MTDFGLTPTGFEAETLLDALTGIETDQHATVSAGLDTSPNSPDGQRNAVSARQIALLWELVQALYDSRDPDRAEDDDLVSICKLTGTVPQGSTFGTVVERCTLTAGEILIADTHFVNVQGRSELWTPDVDFTAPGDGIFDVLFRCTAPGPVPAFASTLTVRNVAPAGWTAATNLLDARQGQPADNNETLRARRLRDLAKVGSATARAVVSDMLALQDSTGALLIQSCTVLENDTDRTDANGVPGHSLEVVVSDTPAVDDSVIATAIKSTAAGGIGTSGSVLSAYVDEHGTSHPVLFSRPDAVGIWLEFTLEVGPEFDAEVFKGAVVTLLQASHGVGSEIRIWDCETAAKQANVLDCALIRLGTFSASSTENLVLPSRAEPAFDTSRVSLVIL